MGSGEVGKLLDKPENWKKVYILGNQRLQLRCVGRVTARTRAFVDRVEARDPPDGTLVMVGHFWCRCHRPDRRGRRGDRFVLAEAIIGYWNTVKEYPVCSAATPTQGRARWVSDRRSGHVGSQVGARSRLHAGPGVFLTRHILGDDGRKIVRRSERPHPGIARRQSATARLSRRADRGGQAAFTRRGYTTRLPMARCRKSSDRQIELGVDIVNDGEYAKAGSYGGYCMIASPASPAVRHDPTAPTEARRPCRTRPARFPRFHAVRSLVLRLRRSGPPGIRGAGQAHYGPTQQGRVLHRCRSTIPDRPAVQAISQPQGGDRRQGRRGISRGARPAESRRAASATNTTPAKTTT